MGVYDTKNLPEALPAAGKRKTLLSDSVQAGKVFGKAGMLSLQKGPPLSLDCKGGQAQGRAVHPTSSLKMNGNGSGC